MKQRRNERTGETGDTRENPPTKGIVKHYSHARKSGSEQPNRSADAAPTDLETKKGLLFLIDTINMFGKHVAKWARRSPVMGRRALSRVKVGAMRAAYLRGEDAARAAGAVSNQRRTSGAATRATFNPASCASRKTARVLWAEGDCGGGGGGGRRVTTSHALCRVVTPAPTSKPR
ncbi:hypothetical protein PR048_027210 [Dryococelus australis]|uniref:Uncharacterized protein n=1 Tax=Dryococelus australis TaxID=614101 RepID=A0ABQ9GEU4_9NEOP|nr:hypothetical protein PR048_027210 [Dryococelus australis]